MTWRRSTTQTSRILRSDAADRPGRSGRWSRGGDGAGRPGADRPGHRHGRARSPWRPTCRAACTTWCRCPSAAPASSSGRPAAVAVTDPVRNLAVTPFAGYATVSWEWPPTAQLAEVTWEARRRGPTSTVISLARVPVQGGARVPLGAGAVHGRGARRDHGRRHVVHLAAGDGGGRPGGGCPGPLHGLGAAGGRPVRRAVEEGGRSPSEQGCAGVRVRMVASPGRVMPTRADRRLHAPGHDPRPCSPASRSSTR